MQRQPKAKRPAARAGKPDRRRATKKPRAGKTSGPQTAQQTLPYREMYKDEGNRRKSRERMRKKRAKPGQGRYDLGLSKAHDSKGS